ncbi:uncharacterized protein LAESUDRAFT_728118 [Laetiporus sulphureus 93-53]|uniref:Uncharacterized protein n=1 Tax=Laetiporus sulphureus 93-53 TaxID=1314785 RepID=A0A165D880_9APHY|nr:uncharacterized protein LAESUDRAFT_728118 [Laetiporus sulphureus 93-53]KZT04309.1 hypothetical protein LAESUDRAFT_728118 [Laetiporus sulphureus 93-53]
MDGGSEPEMNTYIDNGRLHTGATSRISFQRTPWPSATTPLRCLDKRGDGSNQHQAGQPAPKTARLALKATAALNWLGSMKETIAKRASHASTAEDSGHEKSPGHVQATPTPICRGNNHPSRLSSATPLHLSSRTRSQDDNTSDNRAYPSISVHHGLTARDSSSISDAAAEKQKRGVGRLRTTRAFGDVFDAAAGKIMGEEDEAERDALDQLLVAVGDAYQYQR